MNFENKKIGIWGFGVVGKSYLKFLSRFKNQIFLYDKKDITGLDLLFLNESGVTVFKNLDDFLNCIDIVFLSPGVNTNNIDFLNKKVFCELDILSQFYNKPVVAITGSVGKTSTVTLMGNLFNQVSNFSVGGNIGTPICDLIDVESDQGLILELSSFQLERANNFSPDIAVITNFHPNHLDRHLTCENYWNAKLNIFKNQKRDQISISPFEFKEKIDALKGNSSNKNYYFTKQFIEDENVFCIKNGDLVLNKNNESAIVFKNINALNGTYIENYIIAISTSFLMGLDISKMDFGVSLNIPHRLEKFCSFNGLEFYNDSKATVAESTLAAVEKLKSQDLILILGGLGKGVDREPLVRSLKNRVFKIYTFGKESIMLKSLCDKYSINCKDFDDLETLIEDIFLTAIAGQKVLFSPSGSSFDLFKDYQHRGDVFKDLVLKRISK